MRTKKQKKKELSDEQLEIVEAKDFFDCTMPGVIRFYTDHYICGNFYKSCWAVTEYPPSTEETAILAHLADRNGVTLRIYNRLVTSMEQRKIVQQDDPDPPAPVTAPCTTVVVTVHECRYEVGIHALVAHH